MSPAPGYAGRSPTVSVVIPALDEAGNIALVLENLPPMVGEVIVVDGGSGDDTVAVARHAYPGVQVVRQTRSGKGNALACGFAMCQGDIVVTLNGDGSTDPGEIPRFVDALLAGAEAAHGSRFRIGGADLAASRLERFADGLLSRMVNNAFGTRFTDVGSSYNAFWRTRLEALGLPGPDVSGRRGTRPVWGDGTEIESLVTIRMAAEGMRVMEVATTRYPRLHGTRRRRRLSRAVHGVRVLLRERRRRDRLAAHPSSPARHDAASRGTTSSVHLPYNRRAEALRPAAPHPAPYVVGERATGRHAVRDDTAPARPYPGPRPDWADSVDRRSVHRSGAQESGAQESGAQESGAHRADSGVRHSALYDTGVRRTGRYDTGVHRTDIYDTGAAEPAREVGGGRRRLDAKDRRVPGESSTR
jgi:Glycosyl transferase family 2